MVKIVTREELQTMLASSPPIVLEALPPKYFLDGHLPGARHFPHDHARSLAPVLLPDKKAPIVVYCASATCQNSHVAAQILSSMGYADVSIYSGGKKDWVEAGLPLEKGGDVQLAA
jgi:rhodanese-related sulfurtransferase